MSDREIWFARRFPVGHPRNAMAPVSPKGRMAFVWFVAEMVLGAIFFGALGFGGMVLVGALVFAAIAALAAWHLLASVMRHSDNTRTVEDYRRMQGGGPT